MDRKDAQPPGHDAWIPPDSADGLPAQDAGNAAERHGASAFHGLPGANADPAESPRRMLLTIAAAAADRDPVTLRRIFFDELHAADAADMVEDLSDEMLAQVARVMNWDLPPELWVELQPAFRQKILANAPDAIIAKALAELDSDDAALVAEDLDEEKRQRVLAAVPRSERLTIESQLAFEEETAGRLMQRDFVAAPEFWTVGQTLDHIRSQGDDVPDIFFEIYVVDPSFRPIGAVRVSTFLKSQRDTMLAAIMTKPEVLIPADMDQEEIALRFQRYHLASAPVIDEAGRLTGMILVDDIVDVIQEENQEDFLALHGVEDSTLTDSVWTSVKARLPWLLVNLTAAFCSAALINLFQGTIMKWVALAALMPLVTSLGGNTGAQALAVAVRSLASRELNDDNAWKIVRREGLTATINGIFLACLTGLVVFVWLGNASLSWVLVLAMICTFAWAGLMGIIAPLALKRWGADPAVASSVFVLTSIDLVGFFVFLSLASFLLRA